MCYVKSPLNYVGGKYKLLPQILPLFPENIDTFWDIFGGGFNVGINVKANVIEYNDSLVELPTLFFKLKYGSIENILSEIQMLIDKYELDKENKDGYLALRKDYNENKLRTIFGRPETHSIYNSAIELYVLICHSFSNQIRFNKRGEFNMPFGKRNFNDEMRKNFISFVMALKEKTIYFSQENFKIIEENYLKRDFFGKNDLVYCDPPYLNSTATYNEQNKWKDEDEVRLLKWLDKLNDKGIKFALSNNLKYENPYLKQWIKENEGRYKVHYLKADYRNCNYQKKDKSEDMEVLIVNY